MTAKLVCESFAAAAALFGPAVFCAQAAYAPTAWADDEMITYSQGNWGDDATTGGDLLATRYFDVYPVNGILEAGIPGVAGHSIRFTGGDKVQIFLPSGGSDGSLTMDHVDPTPPTEAGRFAAEVITLILNVDYSAAGILRGSRDIPFGDLVMYDVSGIDDGTTVTEFLSLAEATLGGGFTGYTPALLMPIADELNGSFNGGGVTDFARDHLTLVPEPGAAAVCIVAAASLVLGRTRRRQA